MMVGDGSDAPAPGAVLLATAIGSGRGVAIEAAAVTPIRNDPLDAGRGRREARVRT
jgi:Cu+-exporting ATPase